MPKRLRPTAPIAPDAILVGDPGRALLLAQELLVQPKMSNHARGLWGYFGETPTGKPLTIQATGIGGPSAALVLADLAELGVRRAVRVGTCVGQDDGYELGELIVVAKARAQGGSAASLGVEVGAELGGDADLTRRLAAALGEAAHTAAVTSVDAHPAEAVTNPEISAADMQTASLLAAARSADVKFAAVLIVTEKRDGDSVLERDELETAERQAGRAAAAVLSG